MSDDERAIRKVISTWLEASAAGDTDRILRLMADDVVFLFSGRPPMRGKAEFAAAQAAQASMRIEAKSEVQEIRVLGEWAWCWNQLTVAITPKAGGASMTLAGPTLSIFRKQPSGDWVLYRDASMQAASPH